MSTHEKCAALPKYLCQWCVPTASGSLTNFQVHFTQCSKRINDAIGNICEYGVFALIRWQQTKWEDAAAAVAIVFVQFHGKQNDEFEDKFELNWIELEQIESNGIDSERCDEHDSSHWCIKEKERREQTLNNSCMNFKILWMISM